MSEPLTDEELKALERRAHVVLDCGGRFEYGDDIESLEVGLVLFAEDSLRAIQEIRQTRSAPELLDDVNDLQGRIEGLEQERARLKVECERLHAMIQRAIHPTA